ncbi:hypothetical protein ACROYT_G008202 [Oculina patagonica]
MKLTWIFVVLAVLVISQPFSSNAAKKAQNGKFVVKQISNKLKTVCPNQKKNLKQVLSIVSSVDLTLRFTHSRISSLETAAKRLNKANAVLLSRLGKMDRKLDAITKMMRKVMNEEKPKSRVICEHKKATLTCKKGEKINIVAANYGRLNKNAARATRKPVVCCMQATRCLVIRAKESSNTFLSSTSVSARF